MKRSGLPHAATSVLSALTMPLVFAVLFRLLTEIQKSLPLTAARAAYFGRMLEFPVAAMMLIGIALLLCDGLERRQKREDR